MWFFFPKGHSWNKYYLWKSKWYQWFANINLKFLASSLQNPSLNEIRRQFGAHRGRPRREHRREDQEPQGKVVQGEREEFRIWASLVDQLVGVADVAGEDRVHDAALPHAEAKKLLHFEIFFEGKPFTSRWSTWLSPGKGLPWACTCSRRSSRMDSWPRGRGSSQIGKGGWPLWSWS